MSSSLIPTSLVQVLSNQPHHKKNESACCPSISFSLSFQMLECVGLSKHATSIGLEMVPMHGTHSSSSLSTSLLAFNKLESRTRFLAWPIQGCGGQVYISFSSGKFQVSKTKFTIFPASPFCWKTSHSPRSECLQSHKGHPIGLYSRFSHAT